MDEIALLNSTLLVGAVLFGVGMAGFVIRRNVILMFLCAEMMLQGVSLSLVAWGRFHNDWGGQTLVIFIIAVAACEAAIGLALIVTLVQRSGTLDAVFWQSLREESHGPYIDQRIPESRRKERIWPTLTPSGVKPEVDEEKLLQRPRM
jgi:NADH-quinone oxidoreductase subunit K